MNQDTPLIKVRNLSKKFYGHFRKNDTALSRFIGMISGGTERKEISVLENVSFEVAPGEILGLIGKNGSGKSTLLRLIAGVYKPSSGKIETNGKIVYLTSVNQGSIPKLTMRENIFMMGSILGLGQKDIRNKFNEIVDFSGLREFVDMKVYQFSTGMIARLNFSIVIHCVKHKKPDILLLDEVLSDAGDEEFQKKATLKFDELINSGMSVILVSHSEASLVKNCKKIIWLENGKIVEIGPPESVFQKYIGKHTTKKERAGFVEKVLNENEILTSMQDRNNLKGILENLQSVLENGIEGDIVELGCNAGTTSLFIRRMLDFYGSKKNFHVYDSFKGLPKKGVRDKQDTIFDEGTCKVERKIFLAFFNNAKLKVPIIHEGWFKEIPDEEYPAKIAFAFFDGDFYESITDSFSKVYHKLTKGAMIVVHDCEYPDLQEGVNAACKDFLSDKLEAETMHIRNNLGIIVKL